MANVRYRAIFCLAIVPTMRPDPTYTEIFEHKFMVEELLRWFLADLPGGRELVDSLDFSDLSQPRDKSVAGKPENLRRYADDMVWRVGFRGWSEDDKDDEDDQDDQNDEDEGDKAWSYLVLVLEFQAGVDFAMPLRIRDYVDNLHMSKLRGGYFGATDRLPPVLPIVLYNGASPWTASPRVIDLVTPGATASGPEAAGIGSRTDPLFSGERYLLLDMHRVAADDLPMDNAAALLAGLENPSLERVAAQVAALRRRLDAPELKRLRETMLLWAQQVSRRRLDLDLGMEDMAEVDRLHESGELEVRLGSRALAERARLRAEGRAEGRVEGMEQGIAAERELLGRQTARKFGVDAAERLAALLAGIDDPERLAEAGDLIIDCATGDDLISRLNGDPKGDSNTVGRNRPPRPPTALPKR